MGALEIPRKMFSQILAQARAEVPVESCALLVGTDHRVQNKLLPCYTVLVAGKVGQGKACLCLQKVSGTAGVELAVNPVRYLWNSDILQS